MPDINESSEDDLDAFAKQNTSFPSWQELLDAGVAEYYEEQLYKDLFD